MTLAQALQIARCKGARSVLGAELLETLLRENRLYAATRRGVRPLTRFKAELFARIWEQLGWIGTQSGKIVALDNEGLRTQPRVPAQEREMAAQCS